MFSKIKLLLKKQDPSVCCLLQAHLRPIDTSSLKVRGWKIICHANAYEKKAGGPILISDKRDLKPNPGGHLVAQWLSICLQAQGVILGSQDRVPHQPPFGEPASHSAMFLPLLLCVSLMNK